VSTLPKTFITPEEYLEIERKAELRSEYYRGETFARAGGTENHTILADNLVFLFRQKLDGSPCLAYSRVMRVRITPTGLYTYPDLVVACGERRFTDERRDTLLNPALIVEILSESTEAYDRGKKFGHYRSLESLQEYVLIAQDRVQVDAYRRQAGEQWLLTVVDRVEDSITLQSI
jgi:Uma2 family endonuclease